MKKHHREQLRELLSQEQALLVPGAYDALSARLIEQAGFKSVLVSGFGVSASSLGMPDLELYTRTDNVCVARNVSMAVNIPIMADADNGYGNAISVMRTVREFETAGVASITLEDQDSPKRCPLISNQESLVSIEEASAKIRAAVYARSDPTMVIVARTDARDPQEMLARAQAYAAAGADMIKLISSAVTSIEIVRTIRLGCDKPLMLSNLGWVSTEPTEQLHGMVAILTEPIMTLLCATQAIQKNLRLLARDGKISADAAIPMSEFETVIDLPRYRELEHKYLNE